MKLKSTPIPFFLFSTALLGFLFPPTAQALRPLSSYSFSLVAGCGGGFQDGPFAAAKFNKPYGMAINPDGTLLFVADSGNNRIRVVHLDEDNKVTTLTGQDQAGKQDGSLDSARFNQPRSIVYLPGDRLAVNDSGNKLIRLVDLKKGTVFTLGGNAPTTLAEGPAASVSMGGIQDLAYLPAADSIFFSQPDQRTLKRLDLKTGLVALVPNGGGTAQPCALLGDQNRLYVADRDSAQVVSLDWKDGALSTPVSACTAGYSVFSMAKSGDFLYALQGGNDALQRLLPQSEPVTLMSVWGDHIPQSRFSPFTELGYGAGFVADPRELKKLYFSNPYYNMILSYRDLHGNPDSVGVGRDIQSPIQKPPHTFRILLAGDSRSAEVTGAPFDRDYAHYDFPPPTQVQLEKRLELVLNTEAALDDVPVNFDVVLYGHGASDPLFLWPTYQLPAAVSKYDADLVLIMQPPTVDSVFPYIFYFTNPITPDGIPLYPNDMEYLLKPPLERIHDGVSRDFYELCKSRHYVHLDGRNFVFDQKLFQDPALHDDLVEMYGKPLDILQRKLSSMKTSSGSPVRLLLCSTHTGVIRPNLEDPKIWTDVAKRYQIPLLDSNDEMTVLTKTFFPLSETGGNDHFTPDGHLVFAYLLAHDLIRGGFIPWSGSSLPSSPTPSATPVPTSK